MFRLSLVLAVAALSTALLLSRNAALNTYMHFNEPGPFLLGFASAFVAIFFTWLLSKYLSSSVLSSDKDDKKLYGLEHAVLNLADVPPKEMWMNMGYWKHESNFPAACRELLVQTLQHAGILVRDDNGAIRRSASTVNLVDVGFGCGDQTLYLTRELLPDENFKELRPIVDKYIGITINKVQAAFALDRLKSDDSTPTKTNIFCADAADPTSWPDSLTQTVSRVCASDNGASTWLLALDTLYHFQPSRQRILSHARNELHASLMAFDLLLSDSASWWQRLILRVICLVASTPYRNFITRAEYINMLVRAGYGRDRIEVDDVSEYVFSGITAYIQQREQQLRPYGMGLGKLNAAAKIFGWWARSGVVRGVIVVARV